MLTVGHNDPGYDPDDTPIQVHNIVQAICALQTWMWNWFRFEIDEDSDFNSARIAKYQRTLQESLQNTILNESYPSARLVLHGHEFWVRYSPPEQPARAA
jgi:hypothetical protein